MADMDKALPNVETELKTPSDEEVAISEQETAEKTGKSLIQKV
jgi:hypothetical protein